MALSNENNPRLVELSIGDVSAGAASTLPGLSMPSDKGGEVKSVHLLNNAALAGDDTNNVQVVLRKRGGNDVATYLNDVASGGLVARDGKEMTMAALEADRKLAAGDDLEIDITHNGTGQALSQSKLIVELVSQ
jgi:hypothetical protein